MPTPHPPLDPGPIYTRGTSYRALAEARQRASRSGVLGVAHGRYGHMLSAEAAEAGANFVLPEAFEAALTRQRAGKGVAQRTFDNMLSSQAMCFNVFAPLASRPQLAAKVLEPFVPGLASVSSMHLEYTPAADVFGDQSGRGGVDCDLLVEGALADGSRLVLVVETKFVEPEFSTCGFRDAQRAARGLPACSDEVAVAANRAACLYASRKGYAYWQRTDQHELLADGAVPDAGCPFGGPLWQLWVNLALAHEEAARRGADAVRFGVCASAANAALLRGGEVVAGFGALLRRPDELVALDLDPLLQRIAAVAPAELEGWARELVARYGEIGRTVDPGG